MHPRALALITMPPSMLIYSYTPRALAPITMPSLHHAHTDVFRDDSHVAWPISTALWL